MPTAISTYSRRVQVMTESRRQGTFRRATAELAEHNRQVFRYMDGFVRCLDHLVEAVQQEDLHKIKSISEEIVRHHSSDDQGNVVKAAQQLLESTMPPIDKVRLRQNALTLLYTCGRN